MSEAIKPGDIVRLRSGGPDMTVASCDMNNLSIAWCWCDWFEGNVFKHERFPVTCLVPVVDEIQPVPYFDIGPGYRVALNFNSEYDPGGVLRIDGWMGHRVGEAIVPMDYVRGLRDFLIQHFPIIPPPRRA